MFPELSGTSDFDTPRSLTSHLHFKMSEFDAFDSEPPAQNTEEDPAAAFLAREQSELAGLEDDSVPQDNGGNLSVVIY